MAHWLQPKRPLGYRPKNPAKAWAAIWPTCLTRTKSYPSTRWQISSTRPNSLPSPGDIPHLGRVEGAVWLRFSLANPGGEKVSKYLVYSYPVTDYAALYIPTSSGIYKRLLSGDASVRSPEVMPNRFMVYPLELAPYSTKTYYMRFKSTGDMALSPQRLGTNGVFPERPLVANGLRPVLRLLPGFYHLFFGDRLEAAQHTSGLVCSLRVDDRHAAWFSSGAFVQEIMGQGLRHCNNLLHLLVISLLYFTGAKFLRVFLNIHEYAPRADRVIQILQWMGIFLIPMVIFNNPATPVYSFILIGVGPWFSTGAALYLWIKGIPHARYFTIGWLIGHLTSTFDLLRIYGAIPYLDFADALMPLALASAMAFYTIALVEKTREYKIQSDMDTLTGLANRRKFDLHLREEWNRNKRYHRPMSLIMADVDCFKDYNDNYGHGAGDECLRQVARVLQDNARRPGDLVARYGGEEFFDLPHGNRSGPGPDRG